MLRLEVGDVDEEGPDEGDEVGAPGAHDAGDEPAQGGDDHLEDGLKAARPDGEAAGAED
jgi:hypothetical protein